MSGSRFEELEHGGFAIFRHGAVLREVHAHISAKTVPHAPEMTNSAEGLLSC